MPYPNMYKHFLYIVNKYGVDGEVDSGIYSNGGGKEPKKGGKDWITKEGQLLRILQKICKAIDILSLR